MFWGGRTRSFFFSLSCICSRALFLRSSRPLSHALCVACAYLLSSPLLFVWGTHTSSHSYACNLPPFSSSIPSFVVHSCCTPFMCVCTRRHRRGRRGKLATCIPAYDVRFPIVSFFFVPSWPRCGFFSGVVLALACLLYAFMACYATYSLCHGLFVFLRRPRVSVSYCLLGGTRYLLIGVRTLCFLRRPRVSVCA